MEINEIKKILYKTKPIAHRFANNGTQSFYDTVIDNRWQVMFVVPNEEMGVNDFGDKITAQLLIRWIEHKPYDLGEYQTFD